MSDGRVDIITGVIKSWIGGQVEIDEPLLLDELAADILRNLDERTVAQYPHEEGDLLVLGPEVLADPDGKAIIWKGEHFIPSERISEWVSNRFIDFLYTLGRDHLPLGTIESIMYDFVDTESSSYCNHFLEGYARDLARRLLDDNVPITNWKHMYRSPDGKTKFTGGDNPHYGT